MRNRHHMKTSGYLKLKQMAARARELAKCMGRGRPPCRPGSKKVDNWGRRNVPQLTKEFPTTPKLWKRRFQSLWVERGGTYEFRENQA